MPEPAIFGQIRQHIAEHSEQLAAVLADPAFAATFGTLEGEWLKRPPQGYDATTPGIEFIKLKSFTASSEPQGWLARNDQLADEIVAGCRAMFPLIRWLRVARPAAATSAICRHRRSTAWRTRDRRTVGSTVGMLKAGGLP
jgi:uncharacterized protein (DUF2461 family)